MNASVMRAMCPGGRMSPSTAGREACRYFFYLGENKGKGMFGKGIRKYLSSEGSAKEDSPAFLAKFSLCLVGQRPPGAPTSTPTKGDRKVTRTMIHLIRVNSCSFVVLGYRFQRRNDSLGIQRKGAKAQSKQRNVRQGN